MSSLPTFPGQGDERNEETTELAYASWGIRVGGYLLDWILVFLAVYVVQLVVGAHTLFWIVSHDKFGQHPTAAQRALLNHRVAVWSAFYLIASFVYTLALLACPWHATVGMRAVSIRLTTEEGEQPSFLRVLARCLVQFGLGAISLISRILAIVPIVDLLWPLWDRRRQTLHDKLVHTVVLRTR